MQQRQVQLGDAQQLQDGRSGHQGDEDGQRLHLGDLAQARLDGVDHFVAHGLDVLERSAAAHCIEELVVVLDEVGLDAHQKDRHARDDGQVGQEHRQVVDQRGPEPADDLLRGRRVVPEHELVDPDAQVVEHADGDQRRKDQRALREVEGDPALLQRKAAQHDQPHAGQQQHVADHEAGQQPFQPPVPQRQRQQHDEQVGGAEQPGNGPVVLEARQQHGHDPDHAHQREAGQHQHAVQQALARQHHEQRQRAQRAGSGHDHQQQAMQVGQDALVLLEEQLVRHKAREGQLRRPGQDQAAGHQVGDRGLELRDQQRRRHHADAEHPHQQDADDGEHPRPRADDARIGVGLEHAGQRVLAQQVAQFESNAGHQCFSSDCCSALS